MIPFILNVQNRQLYRDKKSTSGFQELEKNGRLGRDRQKLQASFWCDKNILEFGEW